MLPIRRALMAMMLFHRFKWPLNGMLFNRLMWALDEFQRVTLGMADGTDPFPAHRFTALQWTRGHVYHTDDWSGRIR